MRLEITEVVQPDMQDGMWLLYDAVFRETNLASPCRQSYDFAEFTEKVQDPEIIKFLVFDDQNELAGFSIVTNQLGKLAWISEPYFHEKFPDLYQDKRIYYVSVIVVKHTSRSKTKYFARLVRAITEYAVRDRGGYVAMDCSENANSLLPQAIVKFRGDGGGYQILDRQLYVVFT